MSCVFAPFHKQNHKLKWGIILAEQTKVSEEITAQEQETLDKLAYTKKRYLTPKEIAAFVLVNFGQKNLTQFFDANMEFFLITFSKLNTTAYANIKLFIQRALSPAKISSINVDEENKKAEVYLRPEEVSLAIGRGGLNIKLASMLTEYTIDVFRELDESEVDEDIYLDEFSDEIDQWIIDAIKSIGLDTAKAVLNAPREMLVEKADLEEETVDNVLKVLRAEFE